MLRITQNVHASGAKSYYSTADYYSEGQELTGQWRGVAARRLGLEGNVRQADWDALCDNRHPQTGKRLTPRRKTERTVGYDFNFHVPKSVSLLYATTRDERLLDAFRDAVDGTMRALEEEMSTRVRKGGKNENRRTGNLAWGEFVHFTSRPVGGIPDPHLHAHCFVFNTTWDEQEQSFKAGQFREIKRDAPYFEAMFHSRFAERLTELGLPIERRGKGWELAGVGKPLIDKFSRRTAQIEEMAREKGIENVGAKAELGAKTRERKQKNMSMAELGQVWRERMSGQELHALATLERKLGGDAEPADEGAAVRAVEFAIDHVFARKSVVPERHLLAEALRHSVGQATVEQVTDQARQADLIVGQRDQRAMVTTRRVLAEERQIITYARNGRGTCFPYRKRHDRFQRDWLNAAQKKAVKHILESRDRIIVVRGAAGVGKTTLMTEAVETIEGAGIKVFAFAPSASASRGTLRDAGFQNAETVATLLKSEKLQKEAAGQLIWIDEAGQLGTQTMVELFALAERIDARLLLSGDRYQHGSVERGAALRLLEEEAGLVPAEVKEIQRQKGAYKEAVAALSEGRTAEGFRKLDALGWVREIGYAERYKQLAADYVEAVTRGKSALVVSPTHGEGRSITAEIRRSLQERCGLGNDERTFTTLEHISFTDAERTDAALYAAGDVLVFHQNAKGFARGERLVVTSNGPIPLDQSARFQVFRTGELKLSSGDIVRITHNGMTADGQHRLNNGSLYRIDHFDDEGNIVFENGWLIGKEFGHLAYGYVVTSHASQSKTVDRVFVGQASESFSASSREQFYVSNSRGREQVTIYTDDKAALFDAVNRSDDRLSATEFVNDKSGRHAVPFREQTRERLVEPSHREPERVAYDRQ